MDAATRRRLLERTLHRGNDGAEGLLQRIENLMGVEREAARYPLCQVATPHVDLAQLATGVGTANLLLNPLGGGLADQATVVATHVGGNRLVEAVAADADRLRVDHAVERDDGDLAGASTDVDDHRALRLLDRQAGPDRGRQITGLERQAKLLILHLNKGYLLIHLKMTGQLIYTPTEGRPVFGGHPQPGGLDDLPNRFTRLSFYLADGSALHFNDMRKFGWIRWSQDPAQEPLIQNLGLEPLERSFTPEVLSRFVAQYPKRNLKQLLLDQELVAGLGNIYVDEALFRAGLRPDRSLSRIKPRDIEKLHSAIQEVLKDSIQKKGTSFRDYKRSNGQPGGFVPYLKVYGRAGEACLDCGKVIKKIRVAGRGTHYCPQCQK